MTGDNQANIADSTFERRLREEAPFLTEAATDLIRVTWYGGRAIKLFPKAYERFKSVQHRANHEDFEQARAFIRSYR